ncbi:unnamed protein product [Ixodes persulcatus]
MADATYAVGESSDTAVLSKVFSEVYHLRARESRELSSSGFVVVNSTSNFWMDVFIRYFLCNESPDHHDDLVFFVKKATRKSTARYFPRVETSVQVFRRASKKLPIADLEMHWEETVYLNLIMQQLEYTLTGAVCTRTSSQHLQVLRRKSQRVYASPSRHSMEDKGELEEMAYPDIFFAVDNYEEAFQGLTLRPGEMLCVELAARDRECGRLQGLLFLGCVRQEALGNAHRARGPPGPNGCHYVGLRGPRGKGHAQVALRRGPAPAQEWPFPPWRRSSEPSTALLAPCSGTLQRCRSERQGIDVFSGDELEADDPRDALRDEPTIAPKGEGLLDALLTFVALPWHHIVADMLDVRREPLLAF